MLPGGTYTVTTKSPGSLKVNQEKTGLTPNTDYEVRLLIRKGISSDPTLAFTGTATVTGS